MFLANRAMQFLSSSSVSLIVASEPLWAAVTAVLCLGEAGEESKQHGDFTKKPAVYISNQHGDEKQGFNPETGGFKLI